MREEIVSNISKEYLDRDIKLEGQPQQQTPLVSNKTIRVLPEDLINKIAAGEVVERPASVIKELIENALDAKADSIVVEIKKAGKELIKVKDNGHGMSKEDAMLCLQRHATSKIIDEEDLYSISTLGFRGEALASISAVSKMSLTTKKADSLEGYRVRLEGSYVVDEGINAATTGTIVEIKELFWNTPARKKFLKTDSVELRHCIDIVTRYALLHNNISFKLIHDGRMLLHAPATADMKENILQIYGRGLDKELLEVNFTDDEVGIVIRGFIVKPLAAKADKSYQSFFVNKRFVKNQTLQRALYDAYHSLLFVGRHPLAVICLELDPTSVDVNVHPQKTEIKIEQKDLVYGAMYKAVYTALHDNSLVPEDTVKSEQVKLDAKISRPKLPDVPKYMFEKAEQTVFVKEEVKENLNVNSTKEASEIVNTVSPDISEDTKKETISNEVVEATNEDNNNNLETETNNEAIQETKIIIPQSQTNSAIVEGTIKLPEMRILGQIHKTFFIAETPGGMLLIDQHVVEERVLYEKFMTEYLNKNVAVQKLLEAELVSFSPTLTEVVNDNIFTLQGLGFALEHFGGNDFSLTTVPTLMGKTQAMDLLKTVVSELSSGKVEELDRIQEEIITMMACRASVKAGDSMTIPQIKDLLQKLSECKLPYTCPHGRAILIRISADELEKKFLRHG